MRNQPLTGYLLHHKPYQENRALYYFFTPTHGVIHGVGKKGMPLFSLMQLFATGKRSLKSFSQIQPISLIEPSLHDSDSIYFQQQGSQEGTKLSLLQTQSLSKVQDQHTIFRNEAGNECATINTKDTGFKVLKAPHSLIGYNLYAGFYLNEILWKLLEAEDTMPKLWQYYQFTLNGLCASFDDLEMKRLLRHFEFALFEALGYGLNLTEDSQGKPMQADISYRLLAVECFEPFCESKAEVKEKANSFTSISIFSGFFVCALGKYLQTGSQTTLSTSELQDWSRLNKQIVDHLLDYQPLKSRELWQQFMRYRIT